MKHTSDSTKKSQDSQNDREHYASQHERIEASSTYRHAKKRGFLTGENLLKSLEKIKWN